MNAAPGGRVGTRAWHPEIERPVQEPDPNREAGEKGTGQPPTAEPRNAEDTTTTTAEDTPNT